MIIHPFVRYAVLVAGIISIAWLTGLTMFVRQIEALETSPVATEEADAIVVLTGGSERLNAGIALLTAHKGKKLFVSGVHPGLTVDRMLINQKGLDDVRGCCIVLGHIAESTFGNAEETRIFMEAENYHSMRLVTANYHMPRSLMVFRAAMPQFDIAPYPVAPDNVSFAYWWAHPRITSLLATEYNKYLVARTRLWAARL